MYSKRNLFVALIAFLGVTMALSGDLGIQHKNSINLMSFMARSSDILESNPARSLDCFGYYVPKLQEIAETYEKDYKACKQATDDSIQNAELKTLEQRNDLTKRSSDTCEVLSQCSGEKLSAKDAFECFASGGTNSQGVMHKINTDANQYLVNFNRQLFLINIDDETCTNKTKKDYETNSATTYDEMTACLLGITSVPKPTDAPATDAPATDSPATDSPATDAPATDAPSTGPPATDAPATESPEPAPEDRLPEEDLYMPRKTLEARLKRRRV